MTSVITAASGDPFTYFVALKYTASRARAFYERERERERELSAKKATGEEEKGSNDSRTERERSESNNTTLDKCGSLSAPRTISAHALAYFKYDIPAILQYAAEFAAADI